MKGISIRKCVLMMAVLVLLPAMQLFAEDTPLTQETLKGLPGFHVIVEDLQSNLLKYEKYSKQFDFNKDSIQRDLENKLKEAGISVLSRDAWLQTPGRPVLYVNVNTHESEKYWFSYNIKMEVRQLVFLEANPAVKTLSGTWSLTITGMTNIGNLRQINNDLKTLTVRFVDAFKAQNRR
jgi:hypothetical protein